MFQPAFALLKGMKTGFVLSIPGPKSSVGEVNLWGFMCDPSIEDSKEKLTGEKRNFREKDQIKVLSCAFPQKEKVAETLICSTPGGCSVPGEREGLSVPNDGPA